MPQTVVITGASDGIGAAAARQLRALGATVVVVGRSPEKTAAVAARLEARFYVADYTLLAEVRRLAEQLGNDLPRIDLLAHNAGGIFGVRELTVDGHERTLQVNHLAPFLLTQLLRERLIESRARVITTSSVANKVFSRLDLDDLELTHRYSARVAYGNAKLANILFTRELHRRHHGAGLAAAAFHPGGVASNFAAESSSLLRLVYRTPLRHRLLISPAAGADTLVWLARTTPGVEWRSGGYYVRRALSGAVDKLADDPEAARALWERSAALLGR